MSDSYFTHFNEFGRGKMVKVGDKQVSDRSAIARGAVYLQASTIAKITQGDINKGDVLGVAQTAGIMGAKKTSDIIPMCHPLMITGVDIHFNVDDQENKIEIEAIVNTSGKTGVEMEALTAVSTCALTIYDMCKAIDKNIRIDQIRLAEKYGGKSGDEIYE